MSRATLELIGEAGDIRTRCESLIQLLERLDRLVDGTEELTVEQETEVHDANWRWAASSQDYTDRAFEAVNEWYKQVRYALEHPHRITRK